MTITGCLKGTTDGCYGQFGIILLLYNGNKVLLLAYLTFEHWLLYLTTSGR